MLVARIRPRANSNAQATSLCGSRSSNIRPSWRAPLMDSRTYRAGAVAASILLVVVALVGASALSRNPLEPSTLPPGGAVREQATNNFDQLVVVLMENKNLDEVYGPAAYMTQLADLYSFSEGWASITNPSQPNYIAILGGSTFGVGGDGNHPDLNHPTIVDILENTSKTWKAFAEDASGSGCSLNPPRGEDHFPFLSYTTITNNSGRCANLLPGSYNEVITAFNAGTNFIWLTPNDCNNMHSCTVATGDAWIQSWVPNLLLAMAGKKAALIIMFDEAYTSPPDIYMSFSGPAAKLAYKSTASYTHYSLLKLIEDVWGGGNLGQGDVTAPSPLEFFNAGGPDFTLSANPGTVSFDAGLSANSTISLHDTGGFNGTVALNAVSVPPGVTTSCDPSNISGSLTSTCTFASSTPGTYIVTATGTNGSLVHTASISVTVTTPASPDFTITATPNAVSFVSGQSASSTISLQSTGGFNGAVSLTAASSPSGVAASCAPSSISGSETSTCTLSSSTPGSYTVTVTGTSGSLVHTTSIGVTVTAPSTPDFSISANPESVSFLAGETVTSTISLTSTGGFNGAVALTAASSPSGVAASCAPSSISGSQTSTCTLGGSTPGSYTVTVTGTDASLVHTTSISVAVTAPASPDFSITATPNTVAFVAGQSAFSTISLQSTGGFNGAVALVAASTPGGVTTSCAPASISGTQTSACTMSGAALGSYTVVVTGTNGTLSRTASIAVTIAATGPTARFTFAPPYPRADNSVAFDASSSTDSDPSATLQARWDWEGDGVWDTPYSSTLTIQHAFTTAGAYLVKLEILDSNGLMAGIGQWVAVQNPGGGDKTPPQVSILSPSNATVIASANVTVTGVAWDNVAISTIELSTDNTTWTPTSGTTSWSGSVLLKAGTNHIYARAIDTSGNVRTAVITVIAEQSQSLSPASLADPTFPALIGMSPVVALAAIHAFLWNRSRTPRKKAKKASGSRGSTP